MPHPSTYLARISGLIVLGVWSVVGGSVDGQAACTVVIDELGAFHRLIT